MMGALCTYGYDYAVNIVNEDPLMSVEGFSRAVTNLKAVLIIDQTADMWWV